MMKRGMIDCRKHWITCYIYWLLVILFICLTINLKTCLGKGENSGRKHQFDKDKTSRNILTSIVNFPK